MRRTDSMFSWNIMIFEWNMTCNSYNGPHPRRKRIVDDLFLLENRKKIAAQVERMMNDSSKYSASLAELNVVSIPE